MVASHDRVAGDDDDDVDAPGSRAKAAILPHCMIRCMALGANAP